MQLRKIIKTSGHFPSDEAALLLMRFEVRNILADKVRSAVKRKAAEPVPCHARRAVQRRDGMNPASHTESRAGPA